MEEFHHIFAGVEDPKLTSLGRERRIKMLLDGHTPAKAAAVAGVSLVTAKKWLVRSPTGMQVVAVEPHHVILV